MKAKVPNETVNWVEQLWRGGFSRLALKKLLPIFPNAEAAAQSSPEKINRYLPWLSAKQCHRLFELGQAKVQSQSPFPFITFQDGAYPECLLHLSDPPYLLYFQGRLEVLQQSKPLIAVIGTRRLSTYAAKICKVLVEQMRSFQPVIISGMADGVDGIAQQTALDQGLDCIGILGNSLDRYYPFHHLRLQKRMAREGLLLSEVYPGAPMGPWRFPERNRIIAALAQVILVIEAPEKSGANSTVQFGLEMGREIFVVPGPIDQPRNLGGHRFIQQGAHLLTNVQEIFEILGQGVLPEKSKPIVPDPASSQEKTSETTLSLNDKELEIMRILTSGPMHIDKMVAIGHFSASELSALLMGLNLRGLVQEIYPGTFQRVKL